MFLGVAETEEEKHSWQTLKRRVPCAIKSVLTSRYLKAVRPVHADERGVLRHNFAEPESCLCTETSRPHAAQGGGKSFAACTILPRPLQTSGILLVSG